MSPKQVDPSWGAVTSQQAPVGYQGRRRNNGMQPGAKQYPGAGEADAALAVLKEQFPLYNQDSLTDVLKVHLAAWTTFSQVLRLQGIVDVSDQWS